MKQLYTIIIFMLLFVSAVRAQDYSTALVLGDSPLANTINPAYIPKSSYISLPIPIFGSVSMNANNPFSLNTIVLDNVVQLDEIDTHSQSNVGFTFDILNLGLRSEKGLFTLSISTNYEADMMYPTGMFDFIQNNTMDRMEPFDIDFHNSINTWDELAVGYTHMINDNWSVGIKAKYLQGGIAVNTNQSNVFIEKNSDSYLIRGDVDILIGGYNIDSETFDVDNTMNNRGFSGDIGINYTADDNKWFAGFAVTDIGSVKYASGYHIVSRNPNEKYDYEGIVDDNGGSVDIGSSSLGDLISVTYNDMLDHLDVDKNHVKDLRIWIPATVHLGGGYNFDSMGRHLITGNFLGQVNNSMLSNYSATAGYTYHSKRKNFRLMASATHRKYAPLSVGAGILIGGPGFHMYAMADSNVPGISNYASIESLGFRMGATFWMGAKRKQGPPKVKK